MINTIFNKRIWLDIYYIFKYLYNLNHISQFSEDSSPNLVKIIVKLRRSIVDGRLN